MQSMIRRRFLTCSSYLPTWQPNWTLGQNQIIVKHAFDQSQASRCRLWSGEDFSHVPLIYPIWKNNLGASNLFHLFFDPVHDDVKGFFFFFSLKLINIQVGLEKWWQRLLPQVLQWVKRQLKGQPKWQKMWWKRRQRRWKQESHSGEDAHDELYFQDFFFFSIPCLSYSILFHFVFN